MCSISDDLKQVLKKFRFRKDETNAAIVMKINTETMTVEQDSSFDEDELQVYSYM